MLITVIYLSVLVSPLFIVGASLFPAFRLGPASLQDQKSRGRYAAIASLLLTILGSPSIYLLFYGYGVIFVPAVSFAIGMAVAGIAGRRPWLWALCASPWFPLPSFIYWTFVPPTDMKVFYDPGNPGPISHEIIFFLYISWWICGLLGGGLAAIVSQSQSRQTAEILAAYNISETTF